MSNQTEEQKKSNDDTFDLEIEAQPDTDEIMREAVEAVEAVESMRREDEPEPDEESSTDAEGEESSEIDADDSALAVQLKEAQERTVRALADYENFRRRVDRERVDYARYASEGALSEFLPVLDNLTRALDADAEAKDLRQGVEMIQRQMMDVLSRLKVQQVASVGERFDPSVHEAVAREENDEFEQATVIEEYQTGYLLHDRLLRPSMVRVAVPVEPASVADAFEEGDEGEADENNGTEEDS